MKNSHLSIVLNRHGLRLIDLADRLGVHKSSVTRWGHKRLSAERAIEIEQATGIPRFELRPDLWPQERAA